MAKNVQNNYKGKIFDPRIIEKGDQRVWTSESVILAENGIKNGYKLVENPYNVRIKDANLRKAYIPFIMSDEERTIMKKCMKDKIFFGNNFISLKDAEYGWQRITLRYYQEDLINKYTKNRWNIVMFPRQSGKTTTTIIEICHFLTFNVDKDCVVIAQSDTVIEEILRKIKEAFQSMPFFLQPGFVSFTADKIVLDNGCRLKIGIASESVVQGFSLDLLYIDEFAYISNNMVDKFWANIYPALTNNPESRCIITSTPRGRNKFYQLWNDAINGKNTFVCSRIYWTDVPRKMSQEEFKRITIANVGLDGWLMGYECSFDVGLRSVFGTLMQRKLRERQIDNEKLWSNDNHWFGQVCKDFTFINQNVVEYDFAKDYFLLSSDISEGLEMDFSTIKCKKMQWNVEKQRIEYVEVAVFQSDEISVEDFAKLAADFLLLFNPSKVKYVVENNTFGGEFFQKIKNLIYYEEAYKQLDQTIFAKFIRNSKEDYEFGLRWNQDNKNIAVRLFTQLVNSGELYSSHPQTIEEYLNFGRQKNDTFAANYGHDDLAMSDITASYFIKNNDPYIRYYIKNIELELRKLHNDLTKAQKKFIIDREKHQRKNDIKIASYDNRKLIMRTYDETEIKNPDAVVYI
mgnify:CR=1 FL=1